MCLPLRLSPGSADKKIEQIFQVGRHELLRSESTVQGSTASKRRSKRREAIVVAAEAPSTNKRMVRILSLFNAYPSFCRMTRRIAQIQRFRTGLKSEYHFFVAIALVPA